MFRWAARGVRPQERALRCDDTERFSATILSAASSLLCAEGPGEGFRDKRPRRGGRRLPSSTERDKNGNRGVYPHRAEPVKAPRRLDIEFSPEDLRLDGNEGRRLPTQEGSQREGEEPPL